MLKNHNEIYSYHKLVNIFVDFLGITYNNSRKSIDTPS